MQTLRESRNRLFLYGLFVALAALLILGSMIASPSEPGSSLFLGLSFPRLAVASGLLLVVVSGMFLSVRAWKEPRWAEDTASLWFGKSRPGQFIAWLAAILAGLGWLGVFLPVYRAGFLAPHWERLRPLAVFLLLAGAATLLMVFLQRATFVRGDRQLSRTYRASLLLFLPALGLLGIMLSTDFGIFALEDYWYGAGVPILVPQLLVAIAGGLLLLQAETNRGPGRFDLLLVPGIYLVTALLWAWEPLERSFLFIGPYPPNRALYPFADGALYDTASQFALIGQNLHFYNGLFFERALYASFLVYLHSLVGQDYGQVMAAQAALFAIFPPLLYLIGRALDMRAVGFAAALVAMFRGANSIAASNMIDMANPKMMLTDFPTAIAMALMTYLICEWLKMPRHKWHYTFWIGGALGLAVMLRTNALIFLPLIPLLAFCAWPFRWKEWLASSALILLAVVIITMPWELRNRSLGGTMYSSILTKFQDVIDRRYRTPLPPESSWPGKNALALVSPAPTRVALDASGNPPQDIPGCSSVVCFVPNHFLHNVLTSVLVLPTSPVLDELRPTVRERYPYWRPDWDGTFPGASLFFFLLNVFFILAGVIMAWRQHGWRGLVPLGIFIFYNASNAFARTSGGRYIVPVDWIVTLYFLIGVLQTLAAAAATLGARWALFREPVRPPVPPTGLRNHAARALVILGFLFGAGALVPLAETLHASRYGEVDPAHQLSARQEDLAAAGLSLPDIEVFLQNPRASLSVGRALYPRYYIENEGEVHFYPVVVMGFPRMTFTLIGMEGEQGIVLPGPKPASFPHAVDALVLGCQERFYVDALAVILLDEPGTVYTRSPASPLECPLKQPVCDNNHNCY